MRRFLLLLLLGLFLTQCACAGKSIEVKPRGEMVVGGSVGRSL